MSTVRDTLNGHYWTPPTAYMTPLSKGRFESGLIAS